jgi:hypothetical protein
MLGIKSFDEQIGRIALTMSSNRLLTDFLTRCHVASPLNTESQVAHK